jgi:hypothetical protein
MIPIAAELLATEWSERNRTLTGPRERALVEHVLTQLADPESDYGGLLDELCRTRWTTAATA